MPKPTLPAGPYFGPIPYQYPLYQPHLLPGPTQPVLPYIPTCPPYHVQIHVQPQPQQPLITHQGMLFQEDGYPGPGSLPPGGRWAVTMERDGRRTLWTIMPGETRPSGWAYE
ncbi:hypothetical protein ONS95_007841 [Cadophora gregata]|uniref:uncharacterized protein n=1 Tax=Cadophora gregata TaxID=51156 RepID=UPI0026DB9C72|nr:uncharacterized protein ONS95_007841 [Cadophora gregata]KAK0118974.1 hypothetical protein ONS96_012047 [Cadophora gregata f. sp. sojae]KAK0126227.1 hypothetical protein ONS95_007841 [Cadophora gregata]